MRDAPRVESDIGGAYTGQGALARGDPGARVCAQYYAGIGCAAFPISILMASGISSGASGKRRVITCIPPKKYIGEEAARTRARAQAGLRSSFFIRCVFY